MLTRGCPLKSGIDPAPGRGRWDLGCHPSRL